MYEEQRVSHRRSSGFSLVELVIVIVIIGIVAAIAIPRLGKASSKALATQMLANERILQQAIDDGSPSTIRPLSSMDGKLMTN